MHLLKRLHGRGWKRQGGDRLSSVDRYEGLDLASETQTIPVDWTLSGQDEGTRDM